MENNLNTANDTLMNRTGDEVLGGPVFGVPVKVTLYVSLLVMSLLGNTLVIAVILWTKRLRTDFNYLIASMSISDLFVPLLAIPLRIVQETTLRSQEWLVDGAFGNVLCKLCFFVTDISPVVSVLTLVLISVNRFLITMFPIRRQVFSRKTNRILIISVWLVSMSFFSPYFYTFRLATSNGYTKCIFLWTPAFDDTSAQTIFITLNIALFFFLPFLVISVLYTFIMCKLHRNSKDMADMLNHRQLVSRRRKNSQIITMSITIILAFVLLWGPYYIFFCFLVYTIWDSNLPPNIPNLSVVVFSVQYLGFFNSVVNPWIYFIFLRSYRQSLKHLVLQTCFGKITHNIRLNGLGSSRFFAQSATKSGLLENSIKNKKIATTSV